MGSNPQKATLFPVGAGQCAQDSTTVCTLVVYNNPFGVNCDVIKAGAMEPDVIRARTLSFMSQQKVETLVENSFKKLCYVL